MQSSPMWRRAPSISSSQDSLCLHEKQKQLHSLKLDVEKEYEDLRQRIRTKLSHSQLLKLKHCSKRAKSASSHVIPPGSNVHRHSAQPWRDAGRTSAHQFARSAPRLVHDFIPFRALQARPPLQVRNSKSMGLLQPRLLPQARFTKQDSPQDQAEALLQALKQEAPRSVSDKSHMSGSHAIEPREEPFTPTQPRQDMVFGRPSQVHEENVGAIMNWQVKPTQETFAQKREREQILSLTQEGLNSRFSDMFKAFQYIDIDRSGRLSCDEIKRALDLWNVPVDERTLNLLISHCDKDGDGISYTEFVDALARGTVAPAAMGKRGMQSSEAMGVSAFEHLDLQLGHKPNGRQIFRPTINVRF